MIPRYRAYAAAAALVLALVAALALGFAGFGVHEDMFDLDYAVVVLATGWAPGLALVSGGLGVLAFLAAILVKPRRDRIASLLAVVVAALTYAGAMQVKAVAAASPPIHDVATDWSDPLMFGAAATAARGPSANVIEADPKVQAQPQNPDLTGTRVADVNAHTCSAAAPVVLTESQQAAYDKARAAMLRDGLTLVTENPAGGRIEATATAKWLKLKGDVLVRIKPEGAGARIDIRSISRTGIRDLGENCRRVGRLRAMIAR